jgi:hypothetical protein
VVGKPVTGKNFFGRQDDVARLIRMAESEHVLLLAPRRVGKTSLLMEVERTVPKRGAVTALYVTVGGVRSELELVRVIVEAAAKTRAGKSLRAGTLRRWWRRRGQRVKSIGVGPGALELEQAATSWQEEADRAIEDLLAIDTIWLLMIDELPNMVLALTEEDPSGVRARAFLQWFRAVRQHPAGATKLRFVLAGSVGLDSVTRKYAVSAAINDLRGWRLGAFDEATADAFLVALAAAFGLELPPPLRAHICGHAEWLLPYYLQVIFSALRDQVGTRAPTIADIDAAVDALLAHRHYFNPWDERLASAIGRPHDEHARLVLVACATDPDGAVKATLRAALVGALPDAVERERTLAWILDVLVSDGYLVEHGDRWRFRSRLLRRYWQRYFT